MCIDNYYIEHEPTSIEYLGWAKNHIVEVQSAVLLPESFSKKLHQAYCLLDEVQEYLFNE